METAIWLCPLIAYVVVGLFVGVVAYLAEDPYGHLSDGNKVRQAIYYGVGWPVELVYAICVWFYWTFLHRD